MELVSGKDVYDVEKRNTKKRFLKTDAICAACGTIINSNYVDNCFICDDGNETCDHKDFIDGRQSVDLRILLDFRIEDLKALAELHGCACGGRTKTVSALMKRLYANLLDDRINDTLIRKIVLRNKKKFWFWKDIDNAICKAKKPKGISLVGADDCIETKEIRIMNKKDEIVKVKITPMKNKLEDRK